MTSLPDHLERYLGEIKRGWSRDADGRAVPFQIVECLGGGCLTGPRHTQPWG